MVSIRLRSKGTKMCSKASVSSHVRTTSSERKAGGRLSLSRNGSSKEVDLFPLLVGT